MSITISITGGEYDARKEVNISILCLIKTHGIAKTHFNVFILTLNGGDSPEKIHSAGRTRCNALTSPMPQASLVRLMPLWLASQELQPANSVPKHCSFCSSVRNLRLHGGGEALLTLIVLTKGLQGVIDRRQRS